MQQQLERSHGVAESPKSYAPVEWVGTCSPLSPGRNTMVGNACRSPKSDCSRRRLECSGVEPESPECREPNWSHRPHLEKGTHRVKAIACKYARRGVGKKIESVAAENESVGCSGPHIASWNELSGRQAVQGGPYNVIWSALVGCGPEDGCLHFPVEVPQVMTGLTSEALPSPLALTHHYRKAQSASVRLA